MIELSLGCASLAFVLVNILELPKFNKLLMRKPFACDMCLSGWLALFICFDGLLTPLWMCLTMVATILINKILKS